MTKAKVEKHKPIRIAVPFDEAVGLAMQAPWPEPEKSKGRQKRPRKKATKRQSGHR